jgi:hypothetical protein
VLCSHLSALTNTKTLTATIPTPTTAIETKYVAPEGAICGAKGYLLDPNIDYVGSGRNGSVPECLHKYECNLVVLEEDLSCNFYSEVAPVTYQNTTFKWYEFRCF